MFIVLLRHGIAEDKEGDKPDEERRLTAEGNRKMEQVARSLATILPDADAIVSSPLVRAKETAAWVAKAYDGKIDVEITPALSPGTNPEEFRNVLRRTKASCAYFVGHEPNLSSLMLALTGLQGSVGSRPELKKGGCYGLQVDAVDSPARLRWMLAPGILLQLG